MKSKIILLLILIVLVFTPLRAEEKNSVLYRGVTNELPVFHLKNISLKLKGVFPEIKLIPDSIGKSFVYIPKFFNAGKLEIQLSGYDSLEGKNNKRTETFEIENLPAIEVQLGSLKSPSHVQISTIMVQNRLYAFFKNLNLIKTVKVQILGYDCEINNGLLLQNKSISVKGSEIRELKNELSYLGNYKFSIQIKNICVKIEKDTYQLAPINYTNVFKTNDFVLRLTDRSGIASYSKNLDDLKSSNYKLIEYLKIRETDTGLEHLRAFWTENKAGVFKRFFKSGRTVSFTRTSDSSYFFELLKNDVKVMEGNVYDESITDHCDKVIDEYTTYGLGLSKESEKKMNGIDSVLLTIENLGLSAFGQWILFDQYGKPWMSGKIVSNRQLQLDQIKAWENSSVQMIDPFPFYANFHSPNAWSVFDSNGKIIKRIEAVLYKTPFKYWD